MSSFLFFFGFFFYFFFFCAGFHNSDRQSLCLKATMAVESGFTAGVGSTVENRKPARGSSFCCCNSTLQTNSRRHGLNVSHLVICPLFRSRERRSPMLPG